MSLLEKPPTNKRDRQLPLLTLRTSLGERLGVQVFKSLPTCPGVYFFYDASGKLLYIGQSNDLRARVGSYRHVSSVGHGRRTLRLVARIARVEWETCTSAGDAVELERILLLKHRPPFNRAGVWQGPAWWMGVRDTYSSLEVLLSRQPPDQGVRDGRSWIGPLPSGFRYVHASLMRCIIRMMHPELPLSCYPMGALNQTAPLLMRIPVNARREESRDQPAIDLVSFAAQRSAEEKTEPSFLVRLESLSTGITPVEQSFWANEMEVLRKFWSKRKATRFDLALTPSSVMPLPLFPGW